MLCRIYHLLCIVVQTELWGPVLKIATDIFVLKDCIDNCKVTVVLNELYQNAGIGRSLFVCGTFELLKLVLYIVASST